MINRLKASLGLQIVVAMLLGIPLGLWLGADAKPLSEVGKVVINLIKMVAIPLMFFTILKSIITTHIRAADGLRLVGFSMLNASIALVIGLTLTNWIQPGKFLQRTAVESSTGAPPTPPKLDFVETFKSYIPKSVIAPFAENAVIPLVILSLLFGFAIKTVIDREEYKATGSRFIELIDLLLQSTETVLAWITKLAPIAVLAVVAFAVGEHGFSPFKGLTYYVAVGLLGLLIHSTLVYNFWVGAVSRITLRDFWNAATNPMIYSAGANSSLATLPLTLKALKKLKVRDHAASLGACVGTNINNDGIILYEAMAVLFVAQAHGIDLSLADQILTALLCLVAAMGVAGVPEAGFVSLSIVLTTVGLPMEMLPLLLTVDWIIARGRSIVNVLSDMVISIMIDHTTPRE